MLFAAYSTLFILLNLAYYVVHRRLASGLRTLVRNPISPTPPLQGRPSLFVSVVIAARDEESNLNAGLIALLAQDYPEHLHEIIVVNDRSTDRTAEILQSFSTRFPKTIRVVTIPPGEVRGSPKKRALARGIETARGEILLITDADCRFGNRWISAMAAGFSPDTGAVFGLSSLAHVPEMSRLFWGGQSVEFFSYGVVAAALAGAGFPIHSNANNLAYRRRAFEEAGGFAGHLHITSGDDDFMVQRIHALGRWQVRFCADAAAQVLTSPAAGPRAMWEQRKRWASKCILYGRRQVSFLTLIYGYYLLIALSLVGAVFSWRVGLVGALSFLLKTLLDFTILQQGARLFQKRPLLNFFPLAALLHIPLIILAVLFGTLGGFRWKGQSLSRLAPAAPAAAG